MSDDIKGLIDELNAARDRMYAAEEAVLRAAGWRRVDVGGTVTQQRQHGATTWVCSSRTAALMITEIHS